VNYPDVALPLGTRGETVNFTPSQAWGMADLLTNVTALRQRFGLSGKGIKIGIIDR
jgi:subtilase family serine protease